MIVEDGFSDIEAMLASLDAVPNSMELSLEDIFELLVTEDIVFPKLVVEDRICDVEVTGSSLGVVPNSTEL